MGALANSSFYLFLFSVNITYQSFMHACICMVSIMTPCMTFDYWQGSIESYAHHRLIGLASNLHRYSDAAANRQAQSIAKEWSVALMIMSAPQTNSLNAGCFMIMHGIVYVHCVIKVNFSVIREVHTDEDQTLCRRQARLGWAKQERHKGVAGMAHFPH